MIRSYLMGLKFSIDFVGPTDVDEKQLIVTFKTEEDPHLLPIEIIKDKIERLAVDANRALDPFEASDDLPAIEACYTNGLCIETLIEGMKALGRSEKFCHEVLNLNGTIHLTPVDLRGLDYRQSPYYFDIELWW